jgi:hypothetical protein
VSGFYNAHRRSESLHHDEHHDDHRPSRLGHESPEQ